jgi:hypothetical protein
VVGYLGYTYPAIVLPWIEEQARLHDLNRRANAAKAFSQALGRRHAGVARRVLEFLSDDDRPTSQAAVRSALRNVAAANARTG